MSKNALLCYEYVVGQHCKDTTFEKRCVTFRYVWGVSLQ